MGMKKMCVITITMDWSHIWSGVWRRCQWSQSPLIDHTFGDVGEAVCDHNHFRLIIIFVMCVWSCLWSQLLWMDHKFGHVCLNMSAIAITGDQSIIHWVICIWRFLWSQSPQINLISDVCDYNQWQSINHMLGHLHLKMSMITITTDWSLYLVMCTKLDVCVHNQQGSIIHLVMCAWICLWSAEIDHTIVTAIPDQFIQIQAQVSESV